MVALARFIALAAIGVNYFLIWMLAGETALGALFKVFGGVNKADCLVGDVQNRFQGSRLSRFAKCLQALIYGESSRN